MKLTKFILTILLTTTMHLLVLAQTELIKETGPGISDRLAHEIAITQDPKLGYVPKGKLIAASKQRKQNSKSLKGKASAGAQLLNVTWSERGPNADVVGPSNGNTRPGNGVTSGRVRAVWVDLADATTNTVWVGGIDGGLWKTTNITATPATWTPINDFFGNMAIGSICQDPSDHNIMYFGTGEKATNADAVRGAGVWMSTDHGLTWNVMVGSENYWNVSKVVCDAVGNLYVACNSRVNNAGIVRYTKSSGTWQSITPTGLDARVPDMELSSTGRLHITCGYFDTPSGSSGLRYTDNPATVTSGTWSAPAVSFTPTNINVELASSGNTIYALPSNTSYQVTTIYKSTDGGITWAPTTTTPGFTSGQGWYCMAAAVDPNNANNIIVGSLDCYKSINGGGSWTKISEWVGTTGQYVHADQQSMIWQSNNRVLVSSDGGIHISTNGGSTFTDKNTGLRIKQFYSVAIHPSSANYMLAGAQDNGTHQLNSAGLGSSVEVTGGDGAFVHIDQDQPQYQWGSYVYNQYRRSTNSGSSWSSINFSSSAGRFINPTDYDDVANILYASGAVNAYYRWSNAQTGTTMSSIAMPGLNGGNLSAIKVSPYSSNTVFMAGSLRNSLIKPTLLKVVNANGTPAFTNILDSNSLTGNTNISSIELGTTENNIILAFSNYGISNVYVTSNGGASWSIIDGNLPDMPVRWAMFYPGDNTQAILATETGIWHTSLINGSSTIWDADPNFPNVRVDMLQYRASDGLLAASTHGRGIFTTTIAGTPTCGTVAGLSATSITTSGATVSWSSLAGALNYDVDYKANSSGTWTNLATGTTSLSLPISGLTANTLYDWRVRANCTGLSGSYSQAQFTTLALTCISSYDNSTNGSRGGAAVIPFGTDIKGLINPSGDVDYFRFTISTTGTFSVTLTNLPANYNLALYRNNSQVATSSQTGTTNEVINYTATQTGTYYARVVGSGTAFNASSCYTLRVTLGTATSALQIPAGSILSSLEGLEVELSPNPAINQLLIRPIGLIEKADYVIRDMTGRIIVKNVLFGTESIDISSYSPGVYLVQVKEGDREVKMKFVKQ